MFDLCIDTDDISSNWRLFESPKVGSQMASRDCDFLSYQVLAFKYVKNDTLMWRYRIFEFYRWSSWWMVGCLIYLGSDKTCLHISIKTLKNNLKVDIYFFRVLSWLCALKNGNFRCSNLVSCLWNTVLSSISVCYIERPLTLECKWISNKTFLNMTRDV